MHVGQNLAQESSSARNSHREWKSVVNSWFNEVKDYIYGKQYIPGTGHYTQVIF